MHLRRSHALIGVAVAVLAVGAGLVLRGRAAEIRYVTATVDRGDVLDVVGATGTLQAVTTVQVGSQVSGTIQSLYADFNSTVRKGQVLARLDPSLLQARLGQVQAGLASAQANVERSRATLEDARQKLARAQQLSSEGLVPQADLESARATHAEAAAQLKASQAAVTQAAANVRQAQVDMTHTVIAAPIDGVVIARNVDVGQTVAASLQAPVLFVIANDLSRLQVSASIDEADVGRVRAGQEATFRVDAFPNEVFTGRVEQVRLQPITLQNVVTYTTIIGVDNPGQRLMPGMTATVSVVVDRRDDVLRIPASALRFRPEGFDAGAVRPGRTGAAAGAAAGRPASGLAPGRPPGEGGTPGGGRRRGARRGDASPAAADASPAAADASAPPTARGGGPGRPALVFVLDATGEPQPVRIRPGITDGQFVEVVAGLTEGQAVVTGIGGETARGGPARPGGSPAANPFSPTRPQRRSR
jgi:HlyD family secretion protein